MSIIKLLVFDENTEFRASLEQYTHSLPEIDYRGVASDVEGAIEKYAQWGPDIILYTSELVTGLGLDQFSALRRAWPDVLCYRLTVFDESVYDEFATGQGFDGSLPRAEIEEHLERIFELVKDARKSTPES